MNHIKKWSRRDFARFGVGLGALAIARPTWADNPWPKASVATSQQGVVATVHPLASQAALDAFARGGNAMDAAVAASLMLSVVDGHNSGLGGGGLALVRTADGRISALDGRERAPLNASPAMFFRGDRPDPELSQTGPLAAGVPGLVALLSELSKRFGKVSWSDGLEGAAQVADHGFEADAHTANILSSVADDLRRFEASAKIFLPENKVPKRGERIVQRDLAVTLRQLASQSADWFYSGEFAQRTEAMMKATGGLLSARDFAEYRLADRKPIKTTYRGREIIGFPPPSSGGIHIAQMLGMLEGFDVADIFQTSAGEEQSQPEIGSARGLHLLLEVMKRAMADRAYWLGDADFAKVPIGLMDADYLRKRAADIDLEKAVAVTSHGQPPLADSALFGNKHTTHLTTADRDGNLVALTQTVNTSYGCKMVVPGTGVMLNNEMDDFSIAPGVRNAFGLVGSKANEVAPGKRPLSSMSPSIVLDSEGLPLLSCGAAGGPKIITTVLQLLVRTIDLKQSIAEAISMPRIHHQWSPDVAVCEEALPAAIVNQLEQLGHKINRIRTAAIAQGLQINKQAQAIFTTGAADPRVSGTALGQ